MGSWQLEVGKMFVYVLFPVATFHIFNQPAVFEEWVVKTKKEQHSPRSIMYTERLKKELNKLKNEKLNRKYQRVGKYQDEVI